MCMDKLPVSFRYRYTNLEALAYRSITVVTLSRARDFSRGRNSHQPLPWVWHDILFSSDCNSITQSVDYDSYQHARHIVHFKGRHWLVVGKGVKHNTNSGPRQRDYVRNKAQLRKPKRSMYHLRTARPQEAKDSYRICDILQQDARGDKGVEGKARR